jgi:hypothetical protein
VRLVRADLDTGKIDFVLVEQAADFGSKKKTARRR